MRYEMYERKIEKVARFFKSVLRHLKIIFITTTLLMATLVALLAFKGSFVGEQTYPQELQYGESFEPTANAFLSSVYYEYCPAGTDTWTTDVPMLPGTYKIRSVATSTFGNPRYGEEQSFDIRPRPLTVTAATAPLVYGELPAVKAELAGDDRILCDAFDFTYVYAEEDGSAAEEPTKDKLKGAHILPIDTSIRIVDANGNDVTSGYTITTETTYVNITKRPLEITFDSAEKVYDGTPLSAEGYRITDGSLARGDTVELRDAYLNRIGVGTTESLPSLTVRDADGTDMLNLYDLTLIPGKLTVTPATLHIQTGSDSFIYDGKEHTVLDYTVDVSPAAGETLSIHESTVLQNVGSIKNTLSFTVTDRDGTDTTRNYRLVIEYGTIDIQKRPITLTTASDEWVYDALLHTKESYTITDGTLAAGHTVQELAYADIFYADTKENLLDIAIYDENLNDVSENYDIQFVYGKLTVTPRRLTVTTSTAAFVFDDTEHSDTDIGYEGLAGADTVRITEQSTVWHVGALENRITVAVLDGDGKDVSTSYEIVYQNGTLTVTPAPITVTTDSEDFLYDGTEHRHLIYSLDGFLSYRHTVTILTDTTVLGVGEAENRLSLDILDEEGNSILSDYELTYVFGTLTVQPRPITLTSADHTWTYDANVHDDSSYTIGGKGLAPEHTVEVLTFAQIRDHGTCDNMLTYRILDAEGTDVTENYEISEDYGWIEIVPRPITVTAASAEKVYDGTPLSDARVHLHDSSEYSLCEGHTIDGTTVGSQTVVGSSVNTIVGDVVIYDADGNDVTRNYDITTKDGTLTVTPRPITIVTPDKTWVYDNTIFSCPEFSVANTAEGEGLAPRQEIVPSSFATIINVGETQNSFTYVFQTEDGVPVDAKNYFITEQFGTLTVTPRPFTLTTESTSFVYDGTAHEHPVCTVTEVASGHAFKPISWATVTEVSEGAVDNELIFEIVDQDGNPVDYGNYSIETDWGTLTVTPRPLSLTSLSKTWTYDGYDHILDELVISNADVTDQGPAPGQTVLAFDWITLQDVRKERNTFTFEITAGVQTISPDNYEINISYGDIEVVPRRVTLTTESWETDYDGYEHDWPYFSSSGDDFVDGQSPIVTESTIVRHVTDTPVQNILHFEIKADDGRDVSNNYSISVSYGTLTVTPRPLSYRTDSSPLVYNGQGQGWANFTVTAGSVADFEKAEPTDPPLFVNVGRYENVFSLHITDANGEDVTHNYEISEDYGWIEIVPRPITVTAASTEKVYDGTPLSDAHVHLHDSSEYSLCEGHTIDGTTVGSQTVVGSSANTIVGDVVIYDTDGNDVTDNYAVTEIVVGTLTVTPRPITVTAVDDNKIYDGKPLTNSGVTTDNLVDSHTVRATVDGSQTVVGSSVNTIVGDVVIYDADGNDVTRNYDITTEDGTLTVTPRPITLVSANAKKVYDGTPLTNAQVSVAQGSLPIVEGHRFVCDVTGTRTDVGRSKNTFTAVIMAGDEDVTKNYKITYQTGALDISRRILSVTSASASKPYDGTPLTAPCMEVLTSSTHPLVDGHTLTANVYGSLTEPGMISNSYDTESIVIRDADGNDVTNNYLILDTQTGTLEVTKTIVVTVKTPTASKVYDGTPLTSTAYTYEIDGTLPEGTHLEFTVTGSITDKGTVDNTVTVRLLDSDDLEIRNLVFVVYELGKLTVEPRPLSVSTDDFRTMYDALEHSQSGYTLNGSLVKGHTASIDSQTKKTDVCSTENHIVLKIRDAEGADQTDNYAITYTYGSFVITKRPITVCTGSGSFVYDGAKHSVMTASIVGGDGLAGEDVLSVKDDSVYLIDVGSIANTVKVSILRNKQNVSGNYDVTYEYGTIEVTKRLITVTSADASKPYDGTPLTCDKLTVGTDSPYTLIGTHKITASVSGTITEIGIAPNTYDTQTVDIIDLTTGQSVLACYEITDYATGTLTIRDGAIIVVSTNDASKYYDGEPLTDGGYRAYVKAGKLPEGAVILVEVLGTITDPGRTENTATVRIEDAEGNDITDTCIVDLQLGSLQVFPAPTDDGDGEGGGGGGGGGGGFDLSGSTSGNKRGDGEDDSDEESNEPVVIYTLYSDVSGRVYLKIKSFGDYNGPASATWDSASSFSTYLDGYIPLSYLLGIALENSGEEAYAVTVLPANPGSAQLAIPYFPSSASDILVRDDVMQGSYVSGEYTVFIYNSEAFANAVIPEEYSEIMQQYTEFVYAQYLAIDEETLAFMQEIIAENGFSLSDPDVINQIAYYIQNAASYNLDYDVGLDASANVAVEFLRDYKEGVCRHYATAATMLYRALGIPARYTVGAVGQTVAGEYTNVSSNQGHAWVEVFIDGIGWVPVEVTGGGAGPGGAGPGGLPGADGGEGGGNGGGNGGGGSLDLSGSTSGQSDEEKEPEVVYTLYSDVSGRVYLKVKSFGDYNGPASATWGSASSFSTYLYGNIPLSYLIGIAMENGGEVPYAVTVLPANPGSAQLVIPYFPSFSPDIPALDDVMQGAYIDGEYTVFIYDSEAFANAVIPEEYSEIMQQYAEFVRAQYLAIDEETLTFMQEIIAENGFSRSDPDVINQIAYYIQNAASYNLKYDKGLDTSANVAVEFLRDYKEGVCRHYATAATMLYRALGIPARYTIGYSGQTEAGEYTNVMSNQGHAWVEVFIDGIGWVPVEVTGGGAGPGGMPGANGNEGNAPGADSTDDAPYYSVAPEYLYKVYDGTPLTAGSNVLFSDDLRELILKNDYEYYIKIRGEQTEIGVGVSTIETFFLYDSFGNDITGLYDIELLDGVLNVQTNFIEIYIGSQQQYYNGKSLSLGSTPDVDFLVITDLPDGVTLDDVVLNISLTDAGVITADEINYRLSDYISYKVYDNGVDVTANYQLVVADFFGSYDYDVITVNRASITIRSHSSVREYNGEPLTYEKYDLVSSAPLAEGHTLEVTFNGTITEIGKTQNTFNYVIRDGSGRDVTGNYDVNCIYGMLEVTAE